ncbi:MAG: homocysteine S-methyltransferase family protein [Planctomycetota bacterium]|jgi:5-methyltetrahydrofolate--homocysteine methyltransferase
MGRTGLKKRIREGLFLLDGAMGTQLIARGIEVDRCNEHLNIECPDEIAAVHRDYVEAGSDAVLTNTFGANRYVLGRHGLGERVSAINTAGAKIAREAAGEEKYVLGDIGPSGDFLAPLGSLEAGDLRSAFSEQAKALAAGGVDGFIIETMTAVDEMAIAIEAVKSVSGLPIFASLTFDSSGDDFRTMMGVDLETAISKTVSLGVDAVGFNCGKMSLDNYVRLATEYVCAARELRQDVVLLAEPNAGSPELVEGRAVYNVSREAFAAAVREIHSAGVNIIGGCCGTGPAHIQAVAEKLG